jgi:hypothetical protein
MPEALTGWQVLASLYPSCTQTTFATGRELPVPVSLLPVQAVARCWWGRSARFPAEDTAETTGHSQQQETQQQQQQLSSSSAGAAEQQARASPSSSAGGASTSSSRGGLSVPDQQSLLQLFVDQPGPQAPFSIHNLCAAGAPHG